MLIFLGISLVSDEVSLLIFYTFLKILISLDYENSSFNLVKGSLTDIQL